MKQLSKILVILFFQNFSILFSQINIGKYPVVDSTENRISTTHFLKILNWEKIKEIAKNQKGQYATEEKMELLMNLNM